ncbi:MAG: oligosaccharide flippase family protein [Ferrimonas sp.]
MKLPLVPRWLFTALLHTAGVQMLGRGLALMTAVVFARALGPEMFGQYSIAMSLVTVAILPAVAGVPALLMRELGRSQQANGNALIARVSLLQWAHQHALLGAFFALVVLALTFFLGLWPSKLTPLFWGIVALLPVRALLLNQTAMITALQRPAWSQIPVNVVLPITLLLALFGGAYLWPWLLTQLPLLMPSTVADAEPNRHALSSSWLATVHLLWLQFGAHLGALLVSFMLYRRALQGFCQRLEPPTPNTWRLALLPLSLVALLGTLSNELGTLFLAVFSSEEQVGYFRVAMQLTTLLSMGLQAVNTITGPKIATLYHAGRLLDAQRLLRQSVRLSCACVVPAVVFLVVLNKPLIGWLFGPQYAPVSDLVLILCVGQLVNVLMGSVGLVINMTGYEVRGLIIQLSVLVLVAGLLLVLVPLYQAKGAAIAVTTGLILWNLLLSIGSYRWASLKTWYSFK